MEPSNKSKRVREQLATLLQRLAIQAAAELLDEAIERNDDDAADNALRVYREALAMAGKR